MDDNESPGAKKKNESAPGEHPTPKNQGMLYLREREREDRRHMAIAQCTSQLGSAPRTSASCYLLLAPSPINRTFANHPTPRSPSSLKL
jgi:hypothetical protein